MTMKMRLTMKNRNLRQLLLVACVGLTAGGSSSTAFAATHSVMIQNFKFVPADLTIAAGDTVTWEQKDTTKHTTTSDATPPMWDSGLLAADQTYSFKFDSPGTYPYHCTPHAANMKASVTVQAPTNDGHTVLIQGFKFVPATLTINAGETVTWVQKDTTKHTTTSDATPPVWDSGLLLADQTYQFKFTAPGTYPYHCIPHAANMKASVTVQGETTTTNLPVVNLTSPGKGAVYLVPANLTLQATATETNGTIGQVEFLSGTNLLGTATQAPYRLVWSNVVAGSYLLSARAIDSQGGATTSAATAVIVTDVAAYQQHNLVSDLPGLADHVDTNLLNPWAIATSPTGPFWVSANHTGVSTVYDTTGGVQTLIVTIPPPATGTPPSAPTGMIYNNTTNFVVVSNLPARFVFSTEDGTIAAWNAGSNAVLKADRSSAGAIYKGLAIAQTNGETYLYATDFHNGAVDVFDGSFTLENQPDAFVDATIPPGFAPFGIHNIGGNLYVTYAKQDENKEDDVQGPGLGYVNVFDPEGHFIKRFASGEPLNSPWAVTMAPEGFGPFSGKLLIGNFGNGQISAFDPGTGAYLGEVVNGADTPLSIDGLWDLKFGNGGRGGDGGRLYFTAGIAADGSLEDHGLFGSISATPVMRITSLEDNSTAVTISWAGGVGPYLLQMKPALDDTNWFDLLTTEELYVTVPKPGSGGFYRVMQKAPETVTPFSVLLAGPTEVPAVDSAATGLGSLSLKGTQLSYMIPFSGLSGNAAAAHIHGPATPTNSAVVLIPLSGASGTSGVLSGTVTVTPDQLTNLVMGMTYVNIHTPAHSGGEIRGQVVPLRIPVTMSGSTEVPAVTTQAGGAGWVTLIGPNFFYDIDYDGLSANATAAHLHGPADSTHNANVMFGVEGSSGTSGTLEGQNPLTPEQLTELLSGSTYVNIHTSNNPGGEIRGQVVIPH
jgi:uncharacterized protein (TIGR03118 family)